jgi:hypothetical protein
MYLFSSLRSHSTQPILKFKAVAFTDVSRAQLTSLQNLNEVAFSSRYVGPEMGKCFPERWVVDQQTSAVMSRVVLILSGILEDRGPQGDLSLMKEPPYYCCCHCLCWVCGMRVRSGMEIGVGSSFPSSKESPSLNWLCWLLITPSKCWQRKTPKIVWLLPNSASGSSSPSELLQEVFTTGDS